MIYTTRPIKREDAESFSLAFKKHGIDKPVNLFLSYYSKQQQGNMKIFIAEFHGEFLGYIAIIPNSLSGPFKDMNIPQIVDFSVLQPYQNNGLGNFLIETAEKFILQKYDSLCLAVPLNKDYGKSQKLFAKRSYIPDGTGVWQGEFNLETDESALNDHTLVLYMKKELKNHFRNI